MDYLCAKFGDFSHFGFIMWTDRQAESQRQMIAILSYTRDYRQRE